MDTRLDLAERLIELTRDPDLWTRLQALRSLRQWFYRTGDIAFQRRIIDTYLARMAEPDVAGRAQEPERGAVHHARREPGRRRQPSEEHRRAARRAPAADHRGPQGRRARRASDPGSGRPGARQPTSSAAAVLEAFDGSFFKGRFYARQPEDMIDVGNDREFGFLYEPPLDVLERTFTALLAANLPPEPRRQAIQLCSFFKVPERTSSVAIQARLLAALADSDASVRAAARVVVGSELSLTGAEDDAGRISALNDILTGSGSGDARAAVLAAIGRNGRLGESPVIKAAIRSLLPREDAAADLLPVLGRPDFTAAERLSVIDRGWNRITPPQRISALDLLFAQPALVDRAEPSDQVLDLLRRAATDPSASVRERALSGISGLPAFWSSRKASQLLLIALADDTPAIREARPRPGRIEVLVLGAARRPGASGPTPGRPRRLGATGRPRRGQTPSPGRKVPRTGETSEGPDRGSRARSPCRGRAPGRWHRPGRRAGRSLPVQTARCSALQPSGARSTRSSTRRGKTRIPVLAATPTTRFSGSPRPIQQRASRTSSS